MALNGAFDLDRAANSAVFYSMQNSGQTCISIERVYVEAPVYDEFVQKVTQKVSDLRHGRSEGPGSVDVGAMTFPPHSDSSLPMLSPAVPPSAASLVPFSSSRFNTVLLAVSSRTSRAWAPPPSRQPPPRPATRCARVSSR